MTKYFGRWQDRASMAAEFFNGTYRDNFAPPEGFPTDDMILFASYGGGSYDGDAFVLFERDGVLYEVTGSHCSCYGLENQWKPEETSWPALAIRQRKDDDENAYLYHLHDHDDDAVAAYWALVDAQDEVKP